MYHYEKKISNDNDQIRHLRLYTPCLLNVTTQELFSTQTENLQPACFTSEMISTFARVWCDCFTVLRQLQFLLGDMLWQYRTSSEISFKTIKTTCIIYGTPISWFWAVRYGSQFTKDNFPKDLYDHVFENVYHSSVYWIQMYLQKSSTNSQQLLHFTKLSAIW